MSIQLTPVPRAVAGLALLAALGAGGPALAASPTSFSGVSAHALPALQLVGADLAVDVAGVKSYDELGAAINTVLTLSAQPGALVDMLSWTLNISTVGTSWLSEAGIVLTNSNGDGFLFNPGAGDDFAGTQLYIGSGSLLATGLAFNVLADGLLFMQFFENFVDNPGAADAVYLSGSITLSAVAVPEPASYGLMGLGLLAVAVAAKRRGGGRRCTRIG